MKGNNPFVPPAMGLIVLLLFFYKDDFGIKEPTNVYMTKKPNYYLS